MESLTATIAEVVGKAMAEAGRLGLDAGLEATAEARGALIGEQGLVRQLDTIRFESMDALAARNEASLSELRREVLEANKEAGIAREKVVGDELMHDYPVEDGYHIESQCYLRNKNGEIVRDPETGESRKIDFEVIKDGEIVKSVEVTSETADKTAQLTKEERIREAGGDYIIDRRTGELVRFAPDVQTEVIRRA